MPAYFEKRVYREECGVEVSELGCWSKSYLMQGRNTRSAVAEGLRNIDNRSAEVAEEQYCLIEKPDLEIGLDAKAVNLVEGS